MRIHYAPTPPAFRYPRFKKLIDYQPITPNTIGNVPEATWAALKLSQQKEQSISDLTEYWKIHQFSVDEDENQRTSKLQQLISEVKGIGSWSVDMINMFTFEQLDILPQKDYQLHKAIEEVYGTPIDQFDWSITEAWRPYRSLAVRYLWQWRWNRKSK